MKEQKTLGELRVRTDFNVGGSDLVDRIKADAAKWVDELELVRGHALRGEDTEANMRERNRLVSLAQTAYEEAAMWAVKAATA